MSQTATDVYKRQVLTAIYPPCIALVVLSFTRSWWHNSSRVIAPAMFISLMFGIIDGIKSSAFAAILPAWTCLLYTSRCV